MRICLLILCTLFTVTSEAKTELSNSSFRQNPIWIAGDLPADSKTKVVGTSLIHLSSSENMHGICFNETYLQQNPLITIDSINLVLDIPSFQLDAVDGESLSCSSISNESKSSPFWLEHVPLAIVSRQILTWTLTTLPIGHLESDVVDVLQESMDEWAKEIPIEFVYSGRYSEANVTIGFFSSGYHTVWHKGIQRNCSFPFNKTTLAHAYSLDHSSNLRGHVHYNSKYRWSIYEDTSNAQSAPIYHVSLHETGHILKLPHNIDKDSVMYAALIRMHHGLPDMDVKLAQKKWGVPNETTSKKKRQTTPSTDSIPIPNILSFTNVAAFLITITFIFIVILILTAYVEYKTRNAVNDI